MTISSRCLPATGHGDVERLTQKKAFRKTLSCNKFLSLESVDIFNSANLVKRCTNDVTKAAAFKTSPFVSLPCALITLGAMCKHRRFFRELVCLVFYKLKTVYNYYMLFNCTCCRMDKMDPISAYKDTFLAGL